MKMRTLCARIKVAAPIPLLALPAAPGVAASAPGAQSTVQACPDLSYTFPVSAPVMKVIRVYAASFLDTSRTSSARLTEAAT